MRFPGTRRAGKGSRCQWVGISVGDKIFSNCGWQLHSSVVYWTVGFHVTSLVNILCVCYQNKKSPAICSFLHHMRHAPGVHIASSHPPSAPQQPSPGKMKKLSNPHTHTHTSSLDIGSGTQAHNSLRTSDPESLFQTDKFRTETHRGCLVYSVVC